MLDLPNAEDISSYMWVINCSYYSMFYAALALLGRNGHKIRAEVGIHKTVYHALIYYFIDNESKLSFRYIEQYKDVKDRAEEILQHKEKTMSLIRNLKYEVNKRQEFTYDLGREAEESKATTSYERAKAFITAVKEMIIHQSR